jgi:DNA polymerase-3 subunit delta'
VRLLGQPGAARAFAAALERDRLHHAWILHGPMGTGKMLAARIFAGLVLDPAANIAQRKAFQAPVGTEESRLLDAGTHPDFTVIRKELSRHSANRELRERKQLNIPLDLLRETLLGGTDGEGRHHDSAAFRTAVRGHGKVFVIDEAELLEAEAQNALLKTLEEPGDAALLVLECSRPERLLPTIASRVVRVAFQPLAVDEVARWLGQEGVEARVALDLARLSSGAIGVARRALAEGWLERRAILCACLAGRLDAFAATAALVEVGGELQGKTAAAKARNAARATIDLGIALVRDSERLAAGVEAARLPHGGALLEAGLDLVGPAPRERLEQALAARQDVDLNLAPDAALERMLLAFAPARIERARKA